MVRVWIQLTEAQLKALRACAAAEGRSVADLIRMSVDEALRRRLPTPSRPEQHQRALRFIGQFRSAPADLARRHDVYLAQAYG